MKVFLTTILREQYLSWHIIQPYSLRGEMKKRILYDTDLEKNATKFIKILKQEALASQCFTPKVSKDEDPKKGSITTSITRPNSSAAPSNYKNNSDIIFLQTEHQTCALKHHISDCKNCPEEKRGTIGKTKGKEG